MMKNILQLSLIILIVFAITLPEAHGQRRSKPVDEYFDESGGFKHRLWYGGGFNLGFSGNSIYSVFNIGISPMVGYKIIEPFSVGPRVGLNYSYIKGTATDGQVHAVQPVTWAVGAFTRYKLFGAFFAHFEYEYENQEIPLVDGQTGIYLAYDFDEDKVRTVRESKDNVYLGAGYSSGGIFAYEVMLLYNFLEPENSTRLPFDIRIGFTYKF